MIVGKRVAWSCAWSAAAGRSHALGVADGSGVVVAIGHAPEGAWYALVVLDDGRMENIPCAAIYEVERRELQRDLVRTWFMAGAASPGRTEDEWDREFEAMWSKLQ